MLTSFAGFALVLAAQAAAVAPARPAPVVAPVRPVPVVAPVPGTAAKLPARPIPAPIPANWLPVDADAIEYLMARPLPRKPATATPTPGVAAVEGPKVATVQVAVTRAVGRDEAQVQKLREDLAAGRRKERELLIVLVKQKPVLRLHGQGCVLDAVADKPSAKPGPAEVLTLACRAVTPLPADKP